MKKLLSILIVLISLNSFGQTTQTFIKDSFYFGSNLTPSSSHSKSLFAGRWVADTTVIKNRDTTWHPLYDGTTTTYQGTVYVWYQGKWYAGGSGGGGTRDTAYILQGFGVKFLNVINPNDSFYKPNGVNVTLVADTAGLRNYFNQFYGNTTIINDSSVTVFIVDSIANTPTGSEASGTKYLVGTSPTGVFAGHANSIAVLTGAVWNFTVPEQQDQLINDNADFYATYQFNGLAWVQTNVLWVVGGNRNIGNNAYLGRNDSVSVLFKSFGQTFLIGDPQGYIYNPVFSGLENGTYYFKPGINGKIDTAKFKELVAISPLVLTSGTTGDTLSCSTCGGGSGSLSHVVGINGLSNVNDSTVQLGGTLTKNDTLTASTFYLFMTGSANRVFRVTSTGGDGIYGVASTAGQSGVVGESTNATSQGIGMQGIATNAFTGIRGLSSGTAYAGVFDRGSGAGILDAVSVRHSTGLTGQNGYGVALSAEIDDSSSNARNAGRISWLLDSNGVARASSFYIQTVKNLTTGDRFTIKANGGFKFNDYGLGTYTGTPAYTLQVDASGNIIEGSASGGGTTTNALTMNNSGSGDASGTTFNGSAARTISYSTIGAQQAITRQIHTSGATVTVTGGNYILTVDPSSTLAALTVTLPASPSDLQVVQVDFGGTLTAGTIVTALTISPNSGQTILDNTPPGSATADNTLLYRYRTANTTWYRYKP